jgi:hypothetical protein
MQWPGLTVLLVLTLLIYGNTLRNGYCVDDRLIVEDHPQAAKGFEGIQEIVTTNYLEENGEKGSYRVLPRLSFAIGHGLWGSAPGAEHLINILLFVLTGIALMHLLYTVLGSATGLLVPLTVLLFMAHPIHVEVVSSLKSRDELMQFLFAVASAIGFMRAKGNLGYAVAGGHFLMALMCKESAFQFVAVFPLLAYYRHRRWDEAARIGAVALLAALAYLCILVAVFGAKSIFWMTVAKDGFPFVEHPLLFVDNPSVRIGTAFYGLGYYLRLLLWPHPLSFFYGYGIIPLVPVTSVWAIASGAVHLVLLVAGVRLYFKRHPLGLAILLYLILLSMFSNLAIRMSGIVADRFIYSASLGFCLAVAYGISLLPRMLPMLVSGAMLIGLGGKTMARNVAWHDHITLATTDRDAYPDGGLIRFYRALRIQYHVLDTVRPAGREQWVNEALTDYRALIRIWPPTEAAYTNMAVLYEHELNRPDSALWALLQLDLQTETDTLGTIQLDLARLYGKTGDRQAAVVHARRSVRLMPQDVMAHGLLAEALLLAQMDSALVQYLDTVDARFPTADIAPIFRGNLALRRGNETEAAAQFALAVSRYAQNRPLLEFLIDHHKRNGRPDEAERYRQILNALP